MNGIARRLPAPLITGVVIALSLAAVALPAMADDQFAEKNEIRFGHLDFTQAQDRLALLTRLEAAAQDYCAKPKVKEKPETCVSVVVDRSIKNAPATVRKAVATARQERGAAVQAMR